MKDKKTAFDELIDVLRDNETSATREIQGLKFVRTCAACPEQYDVFDAEGKQVGYVRLRWGHLTCEYPDCGGEMVYETNLDDGWQGCFTSEDDRRLFLEDIANAILRRMDKTVCCPVERVRCVNDLKNGAFGIWFKGTCYKVVRYDEETNEWYIKDECDDTGIVADADFDDYFERIDD